MVNSQRLDAVFAALSDPTRRKIVERLTRRRLTVGESAAGFPISGPAVSKHVRVLEEAGLITREVSGRTHHCRLSPRAMRAAATWIDRQNRYWEAAFARIDALLDSTSDDDES
jgi:DNA-binding transcriptional ArsR family regulator